MSALARPILAGNWKMHGGPADARRFFGEFLQLVPEGTPGTVVIFPPTLSLEAALASVVGRADVRLGVQNVHWEEKGAFTGEISAPMAAAAGARLALVGHSERRHLFGEKDEETARKVSAVLAAGMLPVLCVGETLEEREAGRAGEIVDRQLKGGLAAVDGAAADRVLIAYEPVWAIGTGKTAAPSDAEEMHSRIRSWLGGRFGSGSDRIPILYGGSVKPDNAAELLGTPGVDGVLVGGASLDPGDFARICSATG